MSFQLVISTLAREQLWQIAGWYVEQSGSLQIGLEWYEGFRQALETLAENPLNSSLADESDSFPFELREMQYGSGRRKTHRALFRISGDQVEVLAIRHHAQRDVTPEDMDVP